MFRNSPGSPRREARDGVDMVEARSVDTVDDCECGSVVVSAIVRVSSAGVQLSGAGVQLSRLWLWVRVWVRVWVWLWQTDRENKN